MTKSAQNPNPNRIFTHKIGSVFFWQDLARLVFAGFVVWQAISVCRAFPRLEALFTISGVSPNEMPTFVNTIFAARYILMLLGIGAALAAIWTLFKSARPTVLLALVFFAVLESRVVSHTIMTAVAVITTSDDTSIR
jgi:hypothetical protein